MKRRTPAQLEAERRAVCARAAQGCYFARLGVGRIATRTDIEAALERALALNVDRTTERLLREAHTTLVNPATRAIYTLIRDRLADYGLLPPLRVPHVLEEFFYACWCAWRALCARILRSRPSKRVAPDLQDADRNQLKSTWAKPNRKQSR